MRIITWNVNGLADPKKARQVLRRLLSLKADVIVLQEVYKHPSKSSIKNINDKVAEIESLARYYWKTDMYFDPLGKIAIFSNCHKALQITNTYSNGRIVDFVFTHTAKGDQKLQIPYYSINIRAIYAPASSGTRSEESRV